MSDIELRVSIVGGSIPDNHIRGANELLHRDASKNGTEFSPYVPGDCSKLESLLSRIITDHFKSATASATDQILAAAGIHHRTHAATNEELINSVSSLPELDSQPASQGDENSPHQDVVSRIVNVNA